MGSAQRDIVLRSGKMGVWGWDSRTGRVHWDETVEHLHGVAPGAFEGNFEAFWRRVHPDDMDLVNARIAGAFREGPDYKAEYRTVRDDGSVSRLRVQGQVVRRDGEIVGLVGVLWEAA